MGLAVSMARPGGRITGVSSFGGELVAKRIQLLRELVPGVRRLGVLMNPATVQSAQVEGLLQRLGREIPFEQSTKLELVLNLQAAKAMGIVVPAALRLAADEVIE